MKHLAGKIQPFSWPTFDSPDKVIDLDYYKERRLPVHDL